MTTASESGEFRYQSVVNNLAHALPYLWWVAAVAAVAAPLVDSAVTWRLNDIFSLVLIAGALSGWRHSRSLCEKCVRATPLNTDAAVEKNSWWLRVLHWLMGNPLKYTAAVFGLIGVEAFTSGLISVVANVAVCILLGVIINAQLKHQLLSPWCPWCRWDNGGDDESVPEPVPPSIRADR